jgi:hypothetical protein
VVVIAGEPAGRLELLGGCGEAFGDRAPAVEALDAPRAGHDHVLAAEDLVQFDGLIDALRSEGVGAVVRGAALDVQVIQKLADLLGVVRLPGVVGGIRLDFF